MQVMKRKIQILLFMLSIFMLSIFATSCQTAPFNSSAERGVVIPHLKNKANECYYLDEFMPVPNSMVTGKSGALNLRYYDYTEATYKQWQRLNIILSFYSHDGRCWSLFEESYQDL